MFHHDNSPDEQKITLSFSVTGHIALVLLALVLSAAPSQIMSSLLPLLISQGEFSPTENLCVPKSEEVYDENHLVEAESIPEQRLSL